MFGSFFPLLYCFPSFQFKFLKQNMVEVVHFLWRLKRFQAVVSSNYITPWGMKGPQPTYNDTHKPGIRWPSNLWNSVCDKFFTSIRWMRSIPVSIWEIFPHLIVVTGSWVKMQGQGHQTERFLLLISKIFPQKERKHQFSFRCDSEFKQPGINFAKMLRYSFTIRWVPHVGPLMTLPGHASEYAIAYL